MEALRRNVLELSERLSQMDVAQMKVAGRNEAVSTMMYSIIETHPDLDALEAAIQSHKPQGLPLTDPQARAFIQSIGLFESMIDRERHRREMMAGHSSR